MGQSEQDPDLPRSASNVLGKVQYNLCLTEWWGKWKCRRGKSTLGAQRSANNVLQPMLHPGGLSFLEDSTAKDIFVYSLCKISKDEDEFYSVWVTDCYFRVAFNDVVSLFVCSLLSTA